MNNNNYEFDDISFNENIFDREDTNFIDKLGYELDKKLAKEQEEVEKIHFWESD